MALSPPDWREISWNRVLPWLRLFRSFSLATDPRKLVLAALAIFLHATGSLGISSLFGRGQHSLLGFWTPSIVSPRPIQALPERMMEPVISLASPFWRIFSATSSWSTATESLLIAIWGIVVWGLTGAAICRIAVAQVARSEHVGILAAVRFSFRKALTVIGTPVSPLLGVMCLTLPCLLMGAVYRIPGFGPVVAGILAFLPLLAGMVIAILLIGLALAWPLMLPAVAAEDGDGFDSLSRSYAYVNQRRGYFLFLVAVAWMIGIVSLAFVDVFGRMVVQLTHWALSITGPRATLQALFTPDESDPNGAAGSIHLFWLSLIALLIRAWVYTYFWSSFSTIYLLLRQSVDGTPFHDLEWLNARGETHASEALPTVPASSAPADPEQNEG